MLNGKKYDKLGRSLWVALIAALFTVATNAVPPGTPDEIRARIAPFGEVCRAGEDCGASGPVAATGPLSGKQVYDTYCFACHMTGVGDAPKLDDAPAWAERQAKGMDTLWESLVNGIGTMPAKGTCMGCSDDELREVLDYVLAGGQ